MNFNNNKYKRYLRSKKWRKKKKECIEFYGEFCFMCGKYSKRLQIHHLSYSNIGNESMSDLMALCSRCHKLIHGGVC